MTDRPTEATSAAGERIDNERFQTFHALMQRAAKSGTGTTTYYLGRAGLELLAEIEWLRRRLIGMDHDLSATTAEKEQAEEERDEARAVLAACERREAGLRAALEKLADVAQFVLDRITNGVTSDERYAMKDAARIAMEAYRALAAPDHADQEDMTT